MILATFVQNAGIYGAGAIAATRHSIRPEKRSGHDPQFVRCTPILVSESQGLSRRALVRALCFMEQHISRPIRLYDIAQAACVSRAHFARLFRISTGTTVMGYLLKLRLERSKPLLLEGRQAVADISVALGFCDQSHFSRAFRRVNGLPPKRYARMQGSGHTHLRTPIQAVEDSSRHSDTTAC